MRTPPPEGSERARVEALRGDGRFAEALSLQRRIMADGDVEPEDYWRLGLLLFVTAAWSDAARAFTRVVEAFPEDDLARENLAMSLLRARQPLDALTHLKALSAAHPGKINLLDGLADAYGQLGWHDEAREAGEAALEIRDRAAVDHFPAHDLGPVPPFRADRPGENVISFCLFGDGARYRQGILRNLAAMPFVYPGWRARVHASQDQPPALLQQLAQAGAEIVRLPPPERFADGLFWRFSVMNDPNIRRFLVRDADSVVNVRERVAVDEWIASGTHFHLMRDFYAQTDLVLAGLWGGVAGALPPLADMAVRFSYRPGTESRTADQKFLREIAWPLIRRSCLIHDSLYRSFGARDFPSVGTLPPGRHVGDNDASAR